MNLARFPRIFLAHLPTPLEKLERLTNELAGPDIWIKRDDCTGLATGGNKTRKLEFLMAEAEQMQADIVMTQGATQSNHARQTAAFAAKLGISCHILLEDRTGFDEHNYKENGNVLLDRLHGASIERRTAVNDMNAEMAIVAETMRKAGKKVYIIPGGGSNPTGALGYANCALELVNQANQNGLAIDRLITATGSSGTQAGLAVGLKALNSDIQLLGFGVRAPKLKQEESVFKLAQETATKLGMPHLVSRDDIVADCNYVGEGYGIPREDTLEAVRMFAELEGILLDPVYSAKAAAGLIDYCRKKQFKKGERIVFLHTGGSVALFGYDRFF